MCKLGCLLEIFLIFLRQDCIAINFLLELLLLHLIDLEFCAFIFLLLSSFVCRYFFNFFFDFFSGLLVI